MTALRLVFSGWLQRYPRIRTIVPHLGGPLPFLQAARGRPGGGRSWRARRREPAPDELPSALYRQLWYDTVNSHPAALRCACETFGPDRLLLGTDYPYLFGPRWRPLVSYVENAGLSRRRTRRPSSAATPRRCSASHRDSAACRNPGTCPAFQRARPSRCAAALFIPRRLLNRAGHVPAQIRRRVARRAPPHLERARPATHKRRPGAAAVGHRQLDRRGLPPSPDAR